MDSERLARAVLAEYEQAHGTKVTSKQVNVIGCLMTALLGAVPCFLEAFMSCLSGTSPTPPTGYTPGSRERCD